MEDEKKHENTRTFPRLLIQGHRSLGQLRIFFLVADSGDKPLNRTRCALARLCLLFPFRSCAHHRCRSNQVFVVAEKGLFGEENILPEILRRTLYIALATSLSTKTLLKAGGQHRKVDISRAFSHFEEPRARGRLRSLPTARPAERIPWICVCRDGLLTRGRERRGTIFIPSQFF